MPIEGLSAKGPWLPVIIGKTDEQGNVVCDSEVARVLNAATGDFYIDDTIEQVRNKCICIPLGLPFYTAGQMAWSMGRFFLDIPLVALKAIHSFVQDWQKGCSAWELGSNFMKKITTDIPGRMLTNARHFIFAPVFGAEMLCAALYGIIYPYEGREWEAKTEHRWQENVSFKNDIRWQWPNIENVKATYLAHCFQSRGNIYDGVHFVSHIQR